MRTADLASILTTTPGYVADIWSEGAFHIMDGIAPFAFSPTPNPRPFIGIECSSDFGDTQFRLVCRDECGMPTKVIRTGIGLDRCPVPQSIVRRWWRRLQTEVRP